MLIDGGQIVDVDRSGAPAPSDAKVVHLDDSTTLLPGLVDAHSHLAFDPHGSGEQQLLNDNDATVLARMRRHAAQALRSGVTTLRDLGDRDYLALRLRDGDARDLAPDSDDFASDPTNPVSRREDPMSDRENAVLAPEISAAGPPLTSRGGHCWFLGGEADDPREVAEAVRNRARHGVDVVKIMATGGMGANPDTAQYDFPALRALTETARDHGLRTTAHAHAAVGIRDAVSAGVDGIEHCTFVTNDGVQLDSEIVDTMAAAGTFVGCTVVRPRDDMPDAVLGTIEPYWENQATMHRRGVRVVCCTDAGINPVKTHDVLAADLAFFASRVGTNEEALASVTSLAAISCGLGHRKGRLAPGYDADLLAVTGNPVHDPRVLGAITAIYRAGRPVREPTTRP